VADVAGNIMDGADLWRLQALKMQGFGAAPAYAPWVPTPSTG
jgi:hypothetical protein